ncbi:MAG: ATP-binding protein [Chitinophagaceae bacterium]
MALPSYFLFLSMARAKIIVLMAAACCCLPAATRCQTKKIDQFKQQITLAKTNAAKVDAMLNLCDEKYSLNPDTLNKYATAALSLSRTEKNKSKEILADYYITYSLLLNGLEDSSLRITKHYLDLLHNDAHEHPNYLLFLNLKGLIYYRTNKSKDALNTFFTLQTEASQQNDTLTQILAMRGILMEYTITGQDQEALKWVHSAFALIPDTSSPGYRDIYGLLHTNAAICFLHLHQSSRLPLYADSCNYYGARAISLGRETENLFTICQGLVVNGLILSYLKKIPEAEEKLQQGLQVRSQIGDTLYMISDMSVLASFYANTKQLEKGVAICKKGIDLAQRRKVSSALLLLLYSALAENYRATEHYPEYAAALKQLMTVKDSVNKKNSAEELANFNAQYELQKQETTIVRQKLDIISKDYLYYTTLGLFLFVSVIVFILYKNKQKKEKLRLDRMLDQQLLNEKIAILTAEEKERKRIAADLHDNLGAYAAAISSNVRSVKEAGHYTESLTSRLEENAQDIVNELNNTIWVLKKETQQLTEISDRLKVWLQKLIHNYPDVQYDFDEEIATDIIFSPASALQLFHILQECINNALRHSHCTAVKITFTSSENHWTVVVADNGSGFDANSIVRGNGIHNIQDRANTCGWTIDWKQDQGTRVEIRDWLIG